MVITLLTYDRFQYAETTLRSTLQHLKYGGEVRVHIADDGTADESYVPRLLQIAQDAGITYLSSSSSNRGGYGANFNQARNVNRARNYDDDGLFLTLEDDWELLRELDVDKYSRVLFKRNGEFPIRCIRLGYIGFTQDLLCKFVKCGDGIYLALDPDSPEPHVFAGHPRLETIDFQEAVGPWPEGLEPGATEFAVAHNPEARRGVVWPCDINPLGNMYAHIGTLRAW